MNASRIHIHPARLDPLTRPNTLPTPAKSGQQGSMGKSVGACGTQPLGWAALGGLDPGTIPAHSEGSPP
jgi:hypothetical protein